MIEYLWQANVLVCPGLRLFWNLELSVLKPGLFCTNGDFYQNNWDRCCEVGGARDKTW